MSRPGNAGQTFDPFVYIGLLAGQTLDKPIATGRDLLVRVNAVSVNRLTPRSVRTAHPKATHLRFRAGMPLAKLSRLAEMLRFSRPAVRSGTLVRTIAPGPTRNIIR